MAIENNKNTNPSNRDKRKKIIKRVATALLALVIVLGFVVPKITNNKVEEENIKTYNEFLAFVENDKVERVEYDSYSSYVLFKLKDDETIYQTDNPRITTFKAELLTKNIEVVEIVNDHEIGKIAGCNSTAVVEQEIAGGVMVGNAHGDDGIDTSVDRLTNVEVNVSVVQ